MELLLKIASIGIVTSVVCQILVRSGKDEVAMIASLAGMIIALLMVVDQLRDLFDTVRTVFSF